MSDVSRRQFIVRGGQLVGGVSIISLLAACGDSDSTTSSPATSAAGSSAAEPAEATTAAGTTTTAGTTTAAGESSAAATTAAAEAGTPVKGGTLRFSQTGVPPGYDSQKWWNAQAGIGSSVITERLIESDTYTGERVPRLATAEPTVSDDGLVYTFSLRPDVKFHAGNGTMTADDVKFSWERMMSPDLAAEAAFIYTGVPFVGLPAFLDGSAMEISGIKAVDDLTLEVTLERADSAFLPAFSYGHTGVIPRAYYEGKTLEEVNWAPIGTGPFQLESVDQATGAKFVRNPDYWDPETPFVDGVDLEYNVEPQLALLRIQKGELDLMLEPIPAASLNAIKDDPKMEGFYYEALQNDCQWLSLPTQVKPFDDVRVRKAVAMAIDKEKLAKILKGLGTPAGGSLFSPSSRYTEDGIAHPFDPDGAKALLAEAGFPDGFEAPMLYQNQPPYSEMGPAIIEDLAQIGITVKGEAKIYDQFVQEANPGPPSLLLWAWEDAYGHGSYIADAAFTTGAIDAGCCNVARFSDPKLDELAKQGHDADLAVSDEAYLEIARIVVRDQVLWIPLLYPVRADLANSRVKGFQTAIYPSGQSKPFEKYSIA